MKKNDTKNIIDKNANLTSTNQSLNLKKQHKDWYNRSELGKQKNKPKYAPPKEKKPKKDYK